MVTAADVHLWGQKVGTVLWNENLVCANFCKINITFL